MRLKSFTFTQWIILSFCLSMYLLVTLSIIRASCSHIHDLMPYLPILWYPSSILCSAHKLKFHSLFYYNSPHISLSAMWPLAVLSCYVHCSPLFIHSFIAFLTCIRQVNLNHMHEIVWVKNFPKAIIRILFSRWKTTITGSHYCSFAVNRLLKVLFS